MGYSETMMDHFLNPRNAEAMENADGVGEVGKDSCGDLIRVYLRIRGEVIENASFEAFGCGPAIAASSVVTELVKGKTLGDAMGLSAEAVAGVLGGLPNEKLHCTELAEDAVKRAIKDYYNRNGIAHENGLLQIGRQEE